MCRYQPWYCPGPGGVCGGGVGGVGSGSDGLGGHEDATSNEGLVWLIEEEHFLKTNLDKLNQLVIFLIFNL